MIKYQNYHVVKLAGWLNREAVAAPTMAEALSLLQPDGADERLQVLSQIVRAPNAGAARLHEGPWVWIESYRHAIARPNAD